MKKRSPSLVRPTQTRTHSRHHHHRRLDQDVARRAWQPNWDRVSQRTLVLPFRLHTAQLRTRWVNASRVRDRKQSAPDCMNVSVPDHSQTVSGHNPTCSFSVFRISSFFLVQVQGDQGPSLDFRPGYCPCLEDSLVDGILPSHVEQSYAFASRKTVFGLPFWHAQPILQQIRRHWMFSGMFP